MRFRFEKSLRLGGLVRLYFFGSGVFLGFARRGPRRTIVPPSFAALEPSTTFPTGSSPLVHQRHTERTLLKVALVTALFMAGFVLGHIATSVDAPPEVVTPTEVVVMAPPPVPSPSPGTFAASIASASPVTDAAMATEPKPTIAAPDRVRPPPLTGDEVREAQAWLKVLGFDPGPIDGARGPQTKAAVLRYQAARQTEETGQLDRPLFLKVRKEVGH